MRHVFRQVFWGRIEVDEDRVGSRNKRRLGQEKVDANVAVSPAAGCLL